MVQVQIRLAPILTRTLFTTPGNVCCINWSTVESSGLLILLSVLTRYLPKIVVRKEKNLLGGKDEKVVEEQEEVRN